MQRFLTLNLSENSHQTLLALSETSGEPIHIILDKAIENYRRYLFLTQANQAYTKLKQNETLWQEELQEREEWEQTIADGVE